MKRLSLILVFILLSFALVFAVENDSANNRDIQNDRGMMVGGDMDDHGCMIGAGYSWNATEERCVREWSQGEDRYQNSSGIGRDLSGQIRQRMAEIREGEYNDSLGRLLRVREMAQNLRELRVNNVAAQTRLNISAESDDDGRSRFMIRLRNGSDTEIKIMPDVASEMALQRLRLKACSEDNNCTIELKDVGNNNEERIGYQVQIERHSRILGIFQKKMQVQAEVDAQNGEVISVKKPWWAFIATEPQE